MNKTHALLSLDATFINTRMQGRRGKYCRKGTNKNLYCSVEEWLLSVEGPARIMDEIVFKENFKIYIGLGHVDIGLKN